MRKYLSVCLLMISSVPALAEADDWQDALTDLEKKVFALMEEERGLMERIEILNERANVREAHVNLLHDQLAALNRKLGNPDEALSVPENAAESALTDYGPEPSRKETELLSECAGRIALLKSKTGKSGIAFFAPQDGKARIFVSAPWVAEHADFSLSDLDGNPVPFTQKYSAPVGFDLIGLHPENPDLPTFELTAHNELPAVGERILVVVADGESEALTGIGGAIRGIGPDTLEIDAELTPEMSGAPVLALGSGKVIGIVAQQITGVADDWAIGTRHKDSRNFAIRLDRIGEWEASDLTRFANEAAYVEKINTRTRIASITHMLLESERWLAINKSEPELRMHRVEGETSTEYHARIKEFVEARNRLQREWLVERRRMKKLSQSAMEDARKHSSHPHIMRAKVWTNDLNEAGTLEPGSDLDRNLASIYRHILSDLKKHERDLSAHLSSYHKEQYRIAIADREEGIRVVTQKANRVGR